MIGADFGNREEYDFYATDPIALEKLLEVIDFELRDVWEPSCGMGHLSEVLVKHNLHHRSSDLIDRGYGEVGVDFFEQNEVHHGDILTNPPYKYAVEFCKKGLDLVEDGRHVLMLMRVQFLEGSRRKPFLKSGNLKYVYISSARVRVAKGGDFIKYDTPSANCYAWFVFQKGYTGEPIVRWFN